MTVNVYLSTDASAPTINGTAGSLVTALDAILVNGYGSKSAAGWTIAYTATNKRDYKQGTGSNGFYLDVDDSGPGGSGGQEARIRGYETMSALGTGTNGFPTAAQLSAGIIVRKSTATGSTARAWYCIADATCFHLFVDTGDYTSPTYSMCVSFGDIFSYKSSDTYSTVIIGRDTENSSSSAYERLAAIGHGYGTGTQPMTTAIPGHYIDRIWTGTGGSVACTKLTSMFAGVQASATGSSSSLVTYPNGPDSGLELSPLWICHNNSVRGYLKGLWCPLHNQPTGHGDTFSGTGAMSSKTFLSLNVWGSASTAQVSGQIVLETSNTWS